MRSAYLPPARPPGQRSGWRGARARWLHQLGSLGTELTATGGSHVADAPPTPKDRRFADLGIDGLRGWLFCRRIAQAYLAAVATAGG